jgi:hypothetical protein
MGIKLNDTESEQRDNKKGGEEAHAFHLVSKLTKKHRFSKLKV